MEKTIEMKKNLQDKYEHKCKAQKMILEAEQDDYDNLVKKLHEFMVGMLEYYLLIFKDSAFEGEMEMLPPEAQAAVHLNNMFSREREAWEEKLSDLRKAAGCYLELGKQIKRLAQFIGEQTNHSSSDSANSELMQMVAIMKDKIHSMLEQGMVTEARAVLAEVRAIVPDDKELQQMEETMRG